MSRNPKGTEGLDWLRVDWYERILFGAMIAAIWIIRTSVFLLPVALLASIVIMIVAIIVQM